jgi:hypothetical protein
MDRFRKRKAEEELADTASYGVGSGPGRVGLVRVGLVQVGLGWVDATTNLVVGCISGR